MSKEEEAKVIAVVGLGYVGMVTAALLAQRGNRVIGIEVNDKKVKDVMQGKSPVVEKGLDEIVKKMVEEGRLFASSDIKEAVQEAGIIFVCVGTPSKSDGSVSLDAVIRVSEDIGKALRDQSLFCVVVYRSTMLPGTTENILIPILEKMSGKKEGKEFGVCFMPEFLREGSAIDDFLHPSRTVIGARDKKIMDMLIPVVDLPEVPIVECPIALAEFVKYVDNMFHALKIAFANEVATLASAFGVDAFMASKIFLMDDRLNISRRYLRPGFAFGGSCLPKDLSAMIALSRHKGLELPLLSSIRQSNKNIIERGVSRVLAQGSREIGMLGLAFKPGTDDIRESPYLEVAERLIGKGCNLVIYDNAVNIASLIGSNREQLIKKIPHIMEVMVNNPNEVVEKAHVVCLCHETNEYLEAVRSMKENQVLVDLCGLEQRPECRAKILLLWEEEK